MNNIVTTRCFFITF